jgi:predicted XRE-type DNA-binding protein
MLTRQQAKNKLKTLGWSYRTVAPVLGVRHEHLSHVLNGHRQSLRILRAIETLQPSGREWGKKEVAK